MQLHAAYPLHVMDNLLQALTTQHWLEAEENQEARDRPRFIIKMEFALERSLVTSGR